MARIRIRNTNERIEAEERVTAFLERQSVLYKHWDTNELPDELKEKLELSDEERPKILAVVITLSKAMQNLDELLQKSAAMNTLFEDEIRTMTAGKGILIIKGSEEVGYFDVELDAGDVLFVPESRPHFFRLMETVKSLLSASYGRRENYSSPMLFRSTR